MKQEFKKRKKQILYEHKNDMVSTMELKLKKWNWIIIVPALLLVVFSFVTFYHIQNDNLYGLDDYEGEKPFQNELILSCISQYFSEQKYYGNDMSKISEKGIPYMVCFDVDTIKADTLKALTVMTTGEDDYLVFKMDISQTGGVVKSLSTEEISGKNKLKQLWKDKNVQVISYETYLEDEVKLPVYIDYMDKSSQIMDFKVLCLDYGKQLSTDSYQIILKNFNRYDKETVAYLSFSDNSICRLDINIQEDSVIKAETIKPEDSNYNQVVKNMEKVQNASAYLLDSRNYFTYVQSSLMKNEWKYSSENLNISIEDLESMILKNINIVSYYNQNSIYRTLIGKKIPYTVYTGNESVGILIDLGGEQEFINLDSLGDELNLFEYLDGDDNTGYILKFDTVAYTGILEVKEPYQPDFIKPQDTEVLNKVSDNFLSDFSECLQGYSIYCNEYMPDENTTIYKVYAVGNDVILQVNYSYIRNKGGYQIWSPTGKLDDEAEIQRIKDNMMQMNDRADGDDMALTSSYTLMKRSNNAYDSCVVNFIKDSSVLIQK